MAAPSLNMPTHLLVCAAQVDDPEVEPGGKLIPIALLQSRACQDDLLPFRAQARKFPVNPSQPGHAVGIRERDAMLHLLNVGFGMKIVGVEEGPAKTGGEQFANRAFSRAG